MRILLKKEMTQMIDGSLIIVDVQNDFCPGGALPVPEGDSIVPIVNRIADKFEKVVCTQDWHPPGHISFAGTHEKQPYETIDIDGLTQVLWPDHCVHGTQGADFHPQLDLRPADLIIRKGNNPRIDSYSAFLENDKKTQTGLHYYLKGLGINDVYICGLATDYCVYYTSLDARKFDFNTYLILDAAKGMDQPQGNIENAINQMKQEGVKIIDSDSL